MLAFILKAVLLFACLNVVSGYSEDDFIINQNVSNDNWTSCEEFLNGTAFDLNSVLDIDWMIFYYWSPHQEKSYHVRFSVPSPMLIDRFRLELKDDLKPSVNWSRADLFIETSIDLSGLFISTELPGKFRFIPSFSFQFHYAPNLEFSLKVVDDYLAMMNCEQRVAYGLAPVEKVPSPLKIEAVAGIFGIKNPLGRSYLTKAKYEVPAALETINDDDDYQQDEWRGPSLTNSLLF